MKCTFTCLLAVLLLGLCLFFPAAAADNYWNVTDEADLLTYDEWATLEDMTQRISEQYQCGVYIYTVEDYTDDTDEGPYEAAYTICHDLEIVEGPQCNGVILLLSMRDRKYATFVYGEKALYAFDDYGREALEDEFLDQLHDDQWYDAMVGFASGCEEYLSLAALGTPVRASYTWVYVLVVVISLLLALIVCSVMKSRSRSVRKGTEAAAYVSGDLNLTSRSDVYTHTTETRTKIEHESSSSGGGSIIPAAAEPAAAAASNAAVVPRSSKIRQQTAAGTGFRCPLLLMICFFAVCYSCICMLRLRKKRRNSGIHFDQNASSCWPCSGSK